MIVSFIKNKIGTLDTNGPELVPSITSKSGCINLHTASNNMGEWLQFQGITGRSPTSDPRKSHRTGRAGTNDPDRYNNRPSNRGLRLFTPRSYLALPVCNGEL